MFIEFTTFTSKLVTLKHITQSGSGGSSISSRKGIMVLSVVTTDKKQAGKESVHVL
jgi:hypothetical protein